MAPQLMSAFAVLICNLLLVASGGYAGLTKCCHWTQRKECLGDGKNNWQCPASCACEGPLWVPPEWKEDIGASSLLVASADEPGGPISNGYVGAFVPRGLPGSAGPPYAGVEHVKGVFATAGSLFNGSLNRQVSLAPLASWTSTVYVAEIDGEVLPASASAMDLKHGAYGVAYPAKHLNGRAFCVSRTYAHRKHHHLLITDVNCEYNDAEAHAAPVTVRIAQRRCEESWIYQSLCSSNASHSGYSREDVASGVNGMVCSRSTMLGAETPTAPLPVLGECHTDVPKEGVYVSVLPGTRTKTSFISARYSNVDSIGGVNQDPVVMARTAWLEANLSSSTLFDEHAEAMRSLNLPGIEVGGNLELSKVVNASLHSLNGAYRDDSPYSSAPEGLVATRYYGDAFWDVETWQWPTWLVFWPSMARKALDYRARLRYQAALNARNVNQSMPSVPHVNDGLRYPWQSALAGIEQCIGNNEDHIEGDIALAFAQYWYATHDLSWLKQDGFPVLEGIARYYAARVKYNAGTYHINKTCGPDEYHCHVNDSAFSNAVARFSLMAAYDLAKAAGFVANSTFKMIADKLYIPYDQKHDYHPEFVGFNESMIIKQADTVLMQYPLGVDMNLSTRINDLKMYSKVQDPQGVAMSWAFNSIAWRAVGKEEEAEDAFYKSFSVYSRPPFYTWHEGNASDGSGDQGAPNLLTAAGGFLQAVWAGYGGIRFEAPGVLGLHRPRPLPNSHLLKLRGITFLGAHLDLIAEHDGWTLALAASSPSFAPSLEVTTGAHTSLLSRVPVRFSKDSVAWVREHSESVGASTSTEAAELFV